MNRRWAWAVSVLAGLLLPAVHAEEVAIVKGDRVNVRGQANLKSEAVTQLKKGEAVTVLEEIEVKKPKKGEPAKWAKILLPPNTPVWVYAPYIEPASKTVNIKRLNIRAGPGENFSILGRVERGTPIKEIRIVENWMEIEAPTNAYAFVAAALLEKHAPVPTPTLADTVPAPAPIPQQPTTVETVKPDPTAPPVVGATPTPTTPAPETVTQAPTVTPEPAPRRVVSREGLVIVSRSIQAPTDYALENVDTHKMVNYLHAEDESLKLKNFAGRKVIITGEELIDQRWRNTPIVEVETIRLVP